MTLHELQYCRFLLRCLKDLYVEKSAMSTLLDTHKQSDEAALGDWRSASATMSADSVFRSAIEANFAPLFEKLESAINNEELLASMLTKCKLPQTRVDQIRNLQGRIDVQV
ncbi:MAG: hypothetical protein JWO13_3079 [Acidobacteriales bacterium]|nr:hypothetical protein [Terriglobales bacterium]